METATIYQLFERQQQTQLQWLTSTADERIARLKKLRKALEQYREALQTSMQLELRKPLFELSLHEIEFVLAELRYTIENLKEWMAPKYVPASMGTLSSVSYSQAQPRGVSLILSPWNYPVQLTLCPVIAAIAAGCCCMVKPSELVPQTAEVLQKIIAAAFTEAEICVVNGGVELSTLLLSLPFSHIHFTGSPQVGKVVMKAAAEHLCEVTLELGGKSPAVVDETANVAHAAAAITFGKFVNAGQTCIAPDYVLVHTSLAEKLVVALSQAVKKNYYSTGKLEKADYAQIINAKHFDRITGLLQDALAQGARLALGGESTKADLTIEPTIVAGVRADMKLMQEEIFGPVLPILTFNTPQEALDIIRALDKPLAAYIFAGKARRKDFYLAQIQAGGITVNDTLLHIANMNLPFGGINNSGVGKTHGHYGFMGFSNERGIVKQGWMRLSRVAHPPYARKNWMIRVMRYFLR